MSEYTIRVISSPPPTVVVQADPSFSTRQAIEAAAEAEASEIAAAASAGAAATSASEADTSAGAANTSAIASAASAVEASDDADAAAASASAAAATLASSLKIDQNLADLDNAETALTNLGLTATAAELNTLDGITASTAELNILDGVTATTAELNILDGVTATAAEINLLDGATSVQPTSATVQATTSGSTFDFTDIPSWAKRITVMLAGVSTNGTSALIVQVGSGSILTTGYNCYAAALGTSAIVGALVTSGFPIGGVVLASSAYGGTLTITKLSGNTWVANGGIGSSDSTSSGGGVGFGNVTLSGDLDRLRLTAGGGNTFDAGTVNIMWE